MTLQASLRLFDGMSPALKHMNNALNIVISSFESMQRLSGNAVDTSALHTAREELAQAGAAFQGIEESVQQANRRQQEFNGSIRQGSSAATGLWSTLKRVAGVYLGMQGVKNLVGLSDQIASTDARLNLMVDDGGSVAALEQKIMASANRSRSAYLDTASTVAKLGLNAGNAFQNNDELIGFMEQVNKQFVIGGATAQEQSNAMIQLTQAMAAGALRGEELNSILDGAPGIARAIERYMGIAEGSIKNVAAEGQVTAQVVKNALFAAADEANARFESMPKTWSQIFTQFSNQALEAFRPVLDRINEIGNSERFQAFMNGAVSALTTLGSVAAGVFDFLVSAGTMVIDNWSWISPIILGVAAALAVYHGAQLAANAVNLVSNGIHVAMAAAKMAQLAVTGGLTAATMAQTAAQYGLNAAIYACPLTWIVIAIIAVIAIIYIAVAVFNHFAEASVSATGIVAGVFAVLCAHILNAFVIPVQNMLAHLANFIGNLFNDPVAAVKALFWDMCDTVLGYMANVAHGIEDLINKIPGIEVNLTSGIDWLRGWVQDNAQKVKNGSEWVEYVKAWDYIDYSDAANAGYNFGKGVEDKVKGLFNPQDLGLGGEGPGGWTPAVDAWEDLGNGVKDTAGNTGRMADAMELSSEDLKYLRDIAERDAINEFTTAEIKVDMGGVNNNISSNMDLDGVVSYLEEAIYESISVAAEGVHI